VGRQRVAWQQGGLSRERLGILGDLGFEFGQEAQMTEEWEARFDSLVELLLMRVRAAYSPSDSRNLPCPSLDAAYSGGSI
jgi:hypothetical protein